MKDKESTPELILQKLKTSEEDALKIKDDFLKKIDHITDLQVSLCKFMAFIENHSD